MCRILCVTNRKLCAGDFLRRIEQLAACKPAGIILREKDLAEPEYRVLAEQAMTLCREQEVPCILHSYPDTALALGAEAIHLPMPILRAMTREQLRRFRVVGASCHSLEEALEAQRLGCGYITVGHIFDTDCKREIPGRGLGFLETVCRSVQVPVYAIGGITAERAALTLKAGASGICVMSGAMQCENPQEYLSGFEVRK